jgi:hypothetical protein
MEVFKRETGDILQQLHDAQISYTKCLVALDAAVAALIPKLPCAAANAGIVPSVRGGGRCESLTVSDAALQKIMDSGGSWIDVFALE